MTTKNWIVFLTTSAFKFIGLMNVIFIADKHHFQENFLGISVLVCVVSILSSIDKLKPNT